MQLLNPTSEEIRNAITTRSENFMDVVVPFEDLSCELNETTGSVDFRYNLGIADFSNRAMSQLLTRIELSSTFWGKLNVWNAHQLMIDTFTFCNETTANGIELQQRNNDPVYLFRLNPSTPIELSETDDDDEDEDEEETLPSLRTPVRAILTGAYSRFDDDELFPMLMDELDQDDNVTYLLYEYDDQITRLHVRFDNTQVTHNDIQYSAGLVITNSEVGSSSIWIEPVAYRGTSIYANRSSLGKQDVKLKIVHRGDIDRDRVTNIFVDCRDIAQIGIIQLVDAFQTKIDPNHAYNLVKNIPEFPNRMASILQEEWENEEDLKRAHVAQALIEMAQELPLFKRAKIEQAAGSIIGLFDNYSSRIEQMMEEISDQDDEA